MLLLEINDTEIVLRRDAELLYRQPGVAFVEHTQVVFGDDAMQKSRLHPQHSHNEFWHRLNADPVTPRGRGVGNQADLVYRQLQEIRRAVSDERPALVVAAPAAVTNEQLAVLLGIVAEAGFDVQAIVDASVAAACRQSWDGPCRFVDVSLHRAMVTQLEFGGDGDGAVLRRSAVDEVPAAGFATLLEGWIDVVADRFVDGTRFDPLRIAETEQQVFDQLVAGIGTGTAELTIEVSHDEVSRRISVSRHALAEKSRQRYELLARAIGAAASLALSHRILRLPGLASFLQDIGHTLVPLPDDAVAWTVAQHVSRIVPEPGSTAHTGARLIASLPVSSSGSSTPPSERIPTHVVCNALAVPIGRDFIANDHPGCRAASPDFRVSRGEGGFRLVPGSEAEIALNNSPIDFEHPVAVGDSIDGGGATFQLIAIIDAEGADAG